MTKGDPAPACPDCVHDVDDHTETWDTRAEYGPGCLIPHCACALTQEEIKETD